jgi:hypothetical protein
VARWPGGQVGPGGDLCLHSGLGSGARDFFLKGNYFWVGVFDFQKKKKKLHMLLTGLEVSFGHFVHKFENFWFIL